VTHQPCTIHVTMCSLAHTAHLFVSQAFLKKGDREQTIAL
jgi:hypothetical protein